MFRNIGRRFTTAATASELHSKSIAKYNSGVKLFSEGNLAGALEEFNISIKEEPTSDAYFNIGNIFHEQEDYSEAIDKWKKSIELLPRADAHINIGGVLACHLQTPAAALPHFEDAIKLSPEDGEIYHNYGVVLDHSGKLDDAIVHYSNAVSFGVEPAEAKLRNARARWIAKNAQEEK